MRELVTEIRSAFTSENDISMSTVLDLTYMGAVITETMRLFHPLPGNLRRMAPAEGCTISGHFIPGNTIVACDMYAAGRSSTNFARPSDFVPERHLPDTPEEFRNGKPKAVQAVSQLSSANPNLTALDGSDNQNSSPWDPAIVLARTWLMMRCD
jgi:cytochrome P450